MTTLSAIRLAVFTLLALQALALGASWLAVRLSRTPSATLDRWIAWAVIPATAGLLFVIVAALALLP